MFMFDPVGIAVLIIGTIVSLWAQGKVQGAYRKYSQVGARSGITGAQIARRIMHEEGIHDVELEIVPGEMTDHYDPTKKVVRLSPDVYHGTSIAALGISAHEIGHVIQHARGYTPMHIRSAIYPLTAIGSSLAMPMVLIGFLAYQAGAAFGSSLVLVGIYLFAAAVAFTLVTLPVEFDASRRAMRALSGGGVMTTDELNGTKKVLNAAALTYVAAAVVAVLNLAHLLFIFAGMRSSEE